MYEHIAEELVDFIEKSPSCFHVIANMKQELTKAGFLELKEYDKWELKENGAYFVTRNDSALIAFRIPSKDWRGFQIIASHSDSPTFKIKENPEMEAGKEYVKLNVERYGGMICSTWFDRPLSVAGKLMVQEKNRLRPVLVDVDRDLLLIPNLAIHMNREVNDGYKYNAQTDMLPLFGEGEDKERFMEIVAEAAGVKKEDILGHDLFLYSRQKGTVWGAKKEFVSAPKLDDLESAYTSMRGIMDCEDGEAIAVHCVLDNEEVGSGTKQGAASTFLKDVLTRISHCFGRTDEEYLQALANSFMISSDSAHALHPNKGEKADPVNRPYMNRGIVLKYSANQKYATDGISAGLMRMICGKGEVPLQVFTNRSDMPGGSTLGNISNAQVALNTVDIGAPLLAMHSAYETGGVKDVESLAKMAKVFFESCIKAENGMYEVK